VIRFLYNLLWPIGLLLFLPGYLRKMFRRGGYRRKFAQRFAIYSPSLRQQLQGQQTIWLHAVSVGEVAIALKLARVMIQTNPGVRFALTTTTTTGFALAEKKAPREMEVLYSPLDFWPIMRRAFSVVRPERIILIEAEVWPNLMALAQARRIPVFLVNARLSPRSERRFRKFQWFVRPLFRQLALVCVPDRTDVDRWAAIGADRTRIRYTGSIKFDAGEQPSISVAEATEPSVTGPIGRRTVLFGGSTHSGEEEMLGRVFVQLRRNFPDLMLFLAPRHVERARDVGKQLERMSLGVGFCSEFDSNADFDRDVLILDRTGELQNWYPVASVVFVGKSLTAIGGQNPVEPIQAHKPVIFGPHMENFAMLAHELLTADGAIEVLDESDLAGAVEKLLSNKNARESLVQNAQRVVDRHRGATRRTAELVQEVTSQATAKDAE